jgi:hypothetical protein
MFNHALEPIEHPEPLGKGGAWSPEQQTAHMLDLCEAQMEAALQESDLAVDALVQAFTSMVARPATSVTLRTPCRLRPNSAHWLKWDSIARR